MNTIAKQIKVSRRHRRKHSAEFKSQVVAACRMDGVSIAAVATAHDVAESLARRWSLTAQRGDDSKPLSSRTTVARPAFVPLGLPSAGPTPADIRIELRRGSTVINVSWPSSAAPECAAWVRELLR